MAPKRKSSGSHDVASKKQLLEQPKDSWGVIESISLKNFMCHSRLTMRFPSNINFVVGRNGSGKSAVLTAIIVGLGGNATNTSRGTSLKTLIKTGTNAAVVEITLKNNGDDPIRPELFGSKIIVERKISSDGRSAYKLKNDSGEVVSTKKEDLLSILDEMNLHVDNPLTCLNQEMSKNFLHSNNAKDKYKFFFKSTQLEQMSLDYRYIKEQKNIIKQTLEGKEKLIPGMEKEVLEKEQRFIDLSTLRNLKRKVEELKFELAWAEVAQLELSLSPTKCSLERENLKTPKYDAALQTCVEEEAAAQQKFNELQKKVKEFRHEVKSLEPKRQETKKKYDNAKLQLKKVNNVLGRSTQQKQESLRDRNEVEKRIQELRNIAKIDLEDEKRKREEAISHLQEQSKTFEAQLKSADHKIMQFTLAVQQMQEKLAQSKKEEAELLRAQKMTKQAHSSLNAGKKNRLELFGTKMPDFVKAIEEAFFKKKFSRKPRGPIGACVTLRDPRTAVPVECAIKSFMFSFVVDNHADERKLEALRNSFFKEYERSRIVIYTMKFAEEIYDVSSGKVQHPTYSSVFDLLRIEDPVIANCLIDMAGIESVLVILDTQSALKTMQHGPSPFNCYKAYTGVGDEVYPDRFYSNNKEPVSQFLQENIDDQIEHNLKKQQQISGKLQQIKQEIEACDRDIKKNQSEWSSYEKMKKSTKEKLKNILVKKRGLETTEDPQPFDVKDLEDEVNNYTQQIDSLNLVIEQHSQQSQECLQHVQSTKEAWEDLCKTSKRIADQAEDLTEKINDASSKLEHAKTQKSHYKEKKKKHLECIAELQSTINVEIKRIETESKKAAEICPERIATRRTPNNIESEIKQINRRIQTEESTRDDHEKIVREYYEVREKFFEISKHIKWSKNFLAIVDQYLQEREIAFCRMRDLLAMRCIMDFDVLLWECRFDGKMQFDHDNQLLYIFVKPHENMSLSNDMHALSGGERSFSTVCYILALWQAIESPLRCLDEFDVFMDMANRRVAMNMMVDIALAQKQKQFIFLTPHDISALPKSSRIRVWKMADPERGQTHLPFERA